MNDTALKSKEVTGTIIDIKRFAVHDGPGIRSTVFLKGCPLRCLWCHNPHSQAAGREISFNDELCRFCGQCANNCPSACHEVTPDSHNYKRQNCMLCAKCVDACLPDALSVIGVKKSVSEIMEVVLKDKNYYQNSGGGITISGGEPMSQFSFTKAVMQAAKANDLHIVLDTCGQAPFDKYAEIMPLVDLVHYDIKETNTELHKKNTGVGFELILENLYHIDSLGTAIKLRCPIIPTLNDRTEHLEELAAIASKCSNVQEINIMPFHPYGNTHAIKIGMDMQLQSVTAPSDEQVTQWLTTVSAKTDLPVSRG